jgi:hypothetical protein
VLLSGFVNSSPKQRSTVKDYPMHDGYVLSFQDIVIKSFQSKKKNRARNAKRSLSTIAI